MSQKPQHDGPEANDAPRDALNQLIAQQPERHPLVIGFVGAIGAPWDRVLREFREVLRLYDYSTIEIHLSRLIDNLDYQPWGRLPERGSRDYYKERMDACDQLRADTENGAAMSALAIREIVSHREQQNGARTRPPVAYMLRSLKHPDEVTLLRHVYGPAFLLVGVACSVEERRLVLAESLSHSKEPMAEAEHLIARDESDPRNRRFGQNVRTTFSLADVFIPSATGSKIRDDVARFIESVFGAPFLTPTQHEEGMMFAHIAALRSAAIGRQVGAALIPVNGTPVIAGTNEVPRPGGGQYWVTDDPDFRDFRIGRDPNKIYIRRVVQDLFERLEKNGWLSEDLRDLSGPELFDRASTSDESGSSVLEDARVGDLIEFTRCLHAEQAAIVNAARSGVRTDGASLYTTTFPCHECAKMIIGAGIAGVHYVEPYPKSLVNELFRDMIDVSPSIVPSSKTDKGKVPFSQFLGIAPHWYMQAFRAGERRAGEHAVDFTPQGAFPRTSGWSERGVHERESYTYSAISRKISELSRSIPVDRENAEPEEEEHRQEESDSANKIRQA